MTVTKYLGRTIDADTYRRYGYAIAFAITFALRSVPINV